MTILVTSADHFRSLGAGLWDLYKAGRLVDIAIHCHGHSTRAHRLVLSVFSPVLRASLVPSPETMPDALPTCLCLDHAIERASDLHFLLEFLYRGQVVLPDETQCLESLLRTAKFLQIGSLVDACIRAGGCAPMSSAANDVDDDDDVAHAVKVELSHDSSRDRPAGFTTAKTAGFPSAIGSAGAVKGHQLPGNHALDAAFYPAPVCTTVNRCTEDMDRMNQVEPQQQQHQMLLTGGQHEYLSDGREADDYDASDENLEDGSGDYFEEDQTEMALAEYGEYAQEELASTETVDGGQGTAARPARRRRYTCKQTCNKIFYSKRGYAAHVKSHSGPARSYKCPYCGFLTGQKWRLTNHLVVIHKKSASNKFSNKVFTMIGPTVISNDKAKEYLIEAETGRLDEFVNESPVIKPNGGEVLLFRTSNKADDCNYLRDGYNFWQLGNRVTKELGLRRIYFKLHLGSRQFAEGFSRYVFKLTAPANEHNQYVLIHYVGDESVYEPVLHGNLKEAKLSRAPSTSLKPEPQANGPPDSSANYSKQL